MRPSLNLPAFLLFSVALYLPQAACAVEAPSITNTGDAYATPRTVSMSAPAGSIYYTTDGSPIPSATQVLYTGPFTLTSSVHINAAANVSGTYSATSTADLYFDPSLPLPLFWLKANLGVTTGVGVPQPVSSWTDQTGNSNNASNAVAGTQPVLIPNADKLTDGIKFNGTDQYLGLPSGFSSFTSGASLFMVVKATAFTSGARVIDLGTGASNNNNILLRLAGSNQYAEFGVYDNSGSSSFVSSSPISLVANEYALVEVIQTPGSPNATATAYVNGVAGSTNTSMINIASVTRSQNFLGQGSDAGNKFSGFIAEALLFNLALTSTQRQSLESALMRKYQIYFQEPAAPILSTPGGVLTEPAQVAINSAAGTTTHYSTDGNDPSASSPVYEGNPIKINYSQTLKAIAFKNGLASKVVTANYVLDSNQFPAPPSNDTTAPSINLELPTPSQP